MSATISSSARTTVYRIVPSCLGFEFHRTADVPARTPLYRAAR